MNRDVWASCLLRCGRCSTDSYPEDAAWIDHDLLLARFRPACEHVAEQVRLIRPSTVPVDTRCGGVLPSGARCPAQAGPHGLCPSHDRSKATP